MICPTKFSKEIYKFEQFTEAKREPQKHGFSFYLTKTNKQKKVNIPNRRKERDNYGRAENSSQET